ncbi:immunity protein Imm33 domain-containing protein [Listeria aquatica]|uniref:Imm33-like domain-containing protein n=1 Tax=Listeria aquatica FSL S10-1188 TaxID=1265818 RepID=W7AUS0_9LIST|nr:hypothetical protein [Listeria aquatica]EUJ17397.1 hypothetical protein MAQA_12951 [Listeria aquatica FSL S10-1188]
MIVNGFSFQVAWATYFLEEMAQNCFLIKTNDYMSNPFVQKLEGERKEDLYAIYAYELLKKRPEFIQFLALPYDYMVILKNNNIEAVLNNKDENIWES